MFNLDNEQTPIQTSMMDIDDNDEVAITPTENRDGLNLYYKRQRWFCCIFTY